jgi:hypothetical protein
MYISRPRVVYDSRISLKELNTAELFVVSALRLWMLPHYDPAHEYPDWRVGFARAHINADGEMGFHTFCEMLAAGAIEPLRVQALHCPCLSPHEAWPLRVVSLLQQDRLTPAQNILVQRCAPSAARLALAPARDFARALHERRMWVACHFDSPRVSTTRYIHPSYSTLIH